MARKKVKLAWIANDSSRRATYKKRKRGLVKKVSELSTLCGVNACAIIYSPSEQQPEVWPSAPDAHQVVLRFKRMPEMEQSKKMMNQEAFLRQRMAKLKEQLKKQQKENRQEEIALLLRQCIMGKGLQEVSAEDLSDLAWLVDNKMKDVQKKIDDMKAENLKALAAKQLQQAREERMKMKGVEEGSRPTTALEEVVAMEMEALQRQQWFMDVMNPQDHMVCAGGDDIGMPFGDTNPWLDACYP